MLLSVYFDVLNLVHIQHFLCLNIVQQAELLKRIKLSGLELHTIIFVWEALTVDSNQDLVDMDGIEETTTQLKYLLRYVIENVVKMVIYIHR
jgi:hypothetical protein